MPPANVPEPFMVRFLQGWNAPAKRIEPHLGTPGYSLPDVSEFQWHPMPGTAPNNWVIAPPNMSGWANNRRFDLESGATENVVVLGSDSSVIGRLFICGSRNIAILLGATKGTNPINVHLFTNDHVFYFGNGCTSNTVTFELGYDGATIVVGEDCMFSAGIAVRTHDDHGIIDTETGQTLNAPGNVHFEPHVWVGLDATILKGVRLGFGSIVATRALVTRNVPPKTLVAGLPARVLRTNVSWVRERVPRLDALTRLRALEHRFVS